MKITIKTEWRDITGYEGKYQVSDTGNVRSLNFRRSGETREMKLKNVNGYSMICLNNNDRGKFLLVHRLVSEAFIPNPENKSDVNHINGDKSDNRVSNLEWSTRSENLSHSYRIGLR